MFTSKVLSRRRIDHIIGTWALAGGTLLIFSACTTVASIILRELDLPPVRGDSEIQSFTNLVCFFFFLPYSIRAAAHTKINLLTIPPSLQTFRRLLVIAVWICFLSFVFIAMIGTMSNFFVKGSMSVVLGLPIWVIIPPILCSLILAFIACMIRNTK